MWGWSSTRGNFIFFCRAAEERDERWRRHTNQPNFQWQPRKKWNVFLRNYAMCTLNFSHSSDVERFILSLIFFSKSFCLGFHCLHTIIMPSSCDYATYYLHWNENERGEKGELRTSSKISYKAGRNFGAELKWVGKEQNLISNSRRMLNDKICILCCVCWELKNVLCVNFWGRTWIHFSVSSRYIFFVR